MYWQWVSSSDGCQVVRRQISQYLLWWFPQSVWLVGCAGKWCIQCGTDVFGRLQVRCKSNLIDTPWIFTRHRTFWFPPTNKIRYYFFYLVFDNYWAYPLSLTKPGFLIASALDKDFLLFTWISLRSLTICITWIQEIFLATSSPLWTTGVSKKELFIYLICDKLNSFRNLRLYWDTYGDPLCQNK